MRKLTHEEIASKRYSPDQLKSEPRFPISLLLDNIRSLYNVGSIFRSADGARIAKIYLTGYTPCPPRSEIEKTALGSTLTVPWEYIKSADEAVERIKADNMRLCVLEHTDESRPSYSLRTDLFPLCLVVGNELTGISKQVMGRADVAVDIPMYGMKQSLNVAVATGIALFDFVRILHDGQRAASTHATSP